MTSKELRRVISKLLETENETACLEKSIQLRKPDRPALYRTQKEHWLGWLKEYDGPGAYGRSNWKRDAAFIYNHIQYAPMLIWLGESLGISKVQLKKASNSALKAGKNYARQCAAVRAVIPWSQIESAMRKR